MERMKVKVDYQYFFCPKDIGGENGFFIVRTSKEVMKGRKADIEAILKARSETSQPSDWHVQARKLRKARTNVVSVQTVPDGHVLSLPAYFWDGSCFRQLFVG